MSQQMQDTISTSEEKTLYWIEGDGIGAEIWKVARPIIDAALEKAYGGKKSLIWKELYAGQKAFENTGSYLPESSLEALSSAELAIKGPLATPVGGGIRSLNVALRRCLDLYACIRPVRYFEGIESPVKAPEKVNMVIFRENTEDVYAGIEYKAESKEAKQLISFLNDTFHANISCSDSAIGIKPMSERASKRLIKRALQYALDKSLPVVTLVHKGNIMKYTEGAFREWGYELAKSTFSEHVVLDEITPGKVLLNDRIADAMFQEALLYPEKYKVLASPNLNGDYLSDAIAAQVGGLGIAPGANMSDSLAFFEATHGTAPSIAGKDLANPGSLILCGALLFEHLKWFEAANLLHTAMERVIKEKKVTIDLAEQMQGAKALGCKAFGEAFLTCLAAL